MTNHPNRRFSSAAQMALAEASKGTLKVVQRPEGKVTSGPPWAVIDRLTDKGLLEWEKVFKSDIFYPRLTDEGRTVLDKLQSSAQRR